MQTTSHILMIRPVNFSFNPETAVNNAFQVPGREEEAQEKALAEFDFFVKTLNDNGIDINVINDTPEPHTPDSIFPNNWISFHHDGTVCLYPMYAANRRLERKPGVLENLSQKFRINKTIDFSTYEKDQLFLEGTGSMVLDRDNRIAYACLSPRTDKGILSDFCSRMNYDAVFFEAVDIYGKPIYHTNVLMCVGNKYVVICLDAFPNQEERLQVMNTIRDSGKELIPINLEQMNHFAGNMLQINNAKSEKLLVMSTQAYETLSAEQLSRLKHYNRIIHAPLITIETNGGGSARCMMAEIHLPLK